MTQIKLIELGFLIAMAMPQPNRINLEIEGDKWIWKLSKNVVFYEITRFLCVKSKMVQILALLGVCQV